MSEVSLFDGTYVLMFLFYSSGDFMGGAVADIFYPEPKKKIWSRSRGKLARLCNTDLLKLLKGLEIIPIKFKKWDEKHKVFWLRSRRARSA